MCIPGLDPATLIGIAASGIGSMVNYNMQQSAVDEQNRQNRIAMDRERTARNEEVARQRQWELDQSAEVTRGLEQAAPERVRETAEQQAQATDTPYATAADEYNVGALTGQLQDSDVSEGIGKTVADAAARTRKMLQSAAALSGQSQGLNAAAQALMGMTGQIQNIGSDRRGSMNAARMETSIPAAQVRPSHSPIGDLLMLGGQAFAGRAGQRAGQGHIPGQTFGQPLNAIPWLGALN